MQPYKSAKNKNFFKKIVAILKFFSYMGEGLKIYRLKRIKKFFIYSGILKKKEVSPVVF